MAIVTKIKLNREVLFKSIILSQSDLCSSNSQIEIIVQSEIQTRNLQSKIIKMPVKPE